MTRFVFVSVLLGTTVFGQATPDGPGVAVLSAWLEAFNSGDSARVRAFDGTHHVKAPPVDQTLRFREATGGFTLLRIESSEPLAVRALLQEKDSDTVARLEFTLDSGTPPKILKNTMMVIERPPDLAISRMSEADALAALSSRIDALVARDQFAGALLVARRGKVLYERAFGLADRERGTPTTVETKFQIGSMNKMFTVVAILQLVAAGKLSLDDTVGKHLPDYPNRDVASKVTVRHLLMHTGGTGDIFGPEFTKNRMTLRELSDYVALYGSRGLAYEPGSQHRYSNYGYILLGLLIERLSGTSYDDYVRANIFRPAGMSSTDSLPETAPVGQRSAGYMRRNGAWTSNADTLPWRGTSAGGGYSTVGDLFKFAQALESGRLLSAQMLAESTRRQVAQYGYGFFVLGDGASRSYGHGGGGPGVNGEFLVFPEPGYVVVGLSNLDPPAASRVVNFFALRMPLNAP